MQINRRHLLLSAVASAAPQMLWAQITKGEMQIDTLSDGNLMLPADFILDGMPQQEAMAILAKYGLGDGPFTPPCNVTLARIGDRRVLFDVGAGPDFQPSAGKLASALDLIGVNADEITDVIFTHGHPDHLWGLLDEFDEPVFANAQHHIGQIEFDYWTNPDTVTTIGDARTTFAVGAARRLNALSDQFNLITDGAEVVAGITARATMGHTPGHMSYVLQNDVMVVGDAIGNHHIGFERPKWASGADQEAQMAADTRVALLDQLASDKMLMIGFHLPNGGIGYVDWFGDAFQFVPSR